MRKNTVAAAIATEMIHKEMAYTLVDQHVAATIVIAAIPMIQKGMAMPLPESRKPFSMTHTHTTHVSDDLRLHDRLQSAGQNERQKYLPKDANASKVLARAAHVALRAASLGRQWRLFWPPSPPLRFTHALRFRTFASSGD